MTNDILSVDLTKYFYKFVTNFVTWDKNVTNWGQNLSYDFWIVLILIVIHRTEYYGKNVNMTYRTSYNITFVY